MHESLKDIDGFDISFHEKSNRIININKFLNDVDLSYKKPAICDLCGELAGNTLFYNLNIYKEHKFGEPF